MIDIAVKQFNIDVTKSYFIGDSWRDIQCGKNASIKTVLVGKTVEKTTLIPDLTAVNLLDAIKQLIK
jgi:histidinol phosphatase-like enzyme